MPVFFGSKSTIGPAMAAQAKEQQTAAAAAQQDRETALNLLSALGPELAAAEARMREGKPRPTDSETLNVIKPQFRQIADAAGLQDLDERTLIRAYGKGDIATLSPGQVRVTEAGQPIAEGKPRQLPANEINIQRIVELESKSARTPHEQIELDIRTTGKSLFERNLKKELALEAKQLDYLRGRGPEPTALEKSTLEKLRNQRTMGQNWLNMLMQQSMGMGSLSLQTPQQPTPRESFPDPTQFKPEQVLTAPDGTKWVSDGQQWNRAE